MVKAWSKNQLREIRSTLGRFLAILGIVALGVGFFAGLKVTQPSMLLTGSRYAEDTALFDLRLISTLGLTDEDAAYFKSLQAVETAEGANSVDLVAKKGDRELTLKAMSLSKKINIPCLTAGRLPRKVNECLADDQRFSKSDIGKTLTVTGLSREGAITETELKIVGLASSSLYLNISRGTTAMGGGSLDGFLFVRPELFSAEYYTEIYLRLKNVDRELYSDTYDQQIQALSPDLRQELEMRAQHRYDSIIGDATQLLADARQQYTDGMAQYQSSRREAEQQLKDALQQLRDGAAEIEANRQKLADAEKELADAEIKLEQGRKEYESGLAQYQQQKADAERQIRDAQAEIDKNRALIADGLAQAESALRTYRQLLATRDRLTAELEALEPDSLRYRLVSAMLTSTQAAIDRIEGSEEFEQLQQLLDGQQQLDEAQATLNNQKAEAEKQFAAAKAKLDAAAREITDGEAQIASGKEELENGKQTLAQAEQDLAAGQKEYDEAYAQAQEGFAQAEQELAEGEKAIEDAILELEKLEHPSIYLLDRQTNAGYLSFRSDSGIVDGIAKVFPLFFFLVAAFVCVTTMTRMVDEQRTQIGTMKALGYSDAQISGKYMLYSGSAALMGAVIGFLLGTRLFPWVIWKCYDILYGFAPLSYYFSLPMALISLTAALVCSVGATWAACRTELRRMPASLMRPKAPKAGKRILLEHIPIIWNRFSFLYKVSIRNIVRYKKRLAMMLIGIGGCTALIATGCGIKDSIANIAQDQFDEITHYDVSVTFSVPMSDARQQEFRDTYPDMRECVFLGYYAYESVHDQGISTVYVIATDDAHLSDTVSMHFGGTTVPFPQEGTVIDTTLAETLGIGVGDSIPIRVNDTKTVAVPVVGLFDNHLYHYAIMSAGTYEACFGEKCEYQTAYICTDGDPYDLGSRITDYARTGAVSVMDALRVTVDNMMKSLNAMVFVVIGSACALAFIVIYNLTNITINERIREIATIKVLGFYPRETESYVSREIIMLTVLGALVGLPLGTALHRFVMGQIVMDMVSFRVQILPLSYALAFCITIGMELVTSLLLRRKIEKINMAESLKSVE